MNAADPDLDHVGIHHVWLRGAAMRFDVSAYIARLSQEQDARLTYIRRLYALLRQGR